MASTDQSLREAVHVVNQVGHPVTLLRSGHANSAYENALVNRHHHRRKGNQLLVVTALADARAAAHLQRSRKRY